MVAGNGQEILLLTLTKIINLVFIQMVQEHWMVSRTMRRTTLLSGLVAITGEKGPVVQALRMMAVQMVMIVSRRNLLQKIF